MKKKKKKQNNTQYLHGSTSLVTNNDNAPLLILPSLYRYCGLHAVSILFSKTVPLFLACFNLILEVEKDFILHALFSRLRQSLFYPLVFPRLLIGLLWVFMHHPTLADDSKAKAILDQVSTYYHSLYSFQVDFEQVTTSPGKKTEKVTGAIAVKGKKYRLQLEDQIIFNNGQTISTYLKEEKEVTINHFTPEKGDFNPATLYELHKQGYVCVSHTQKILQKAKYDCIELIPEKQPPKEETADNDLIKMQLIINQKTKQIHQWKTFSRDHTVSTYHFKNFNPTVRLKDRYFHFNTEQHPDVEIVDLR